MNESRLSWAAAVLRQLGLWTDEKPVRVLAGERPAYSERDVLQAMESGDSMSRLCCSRKKDGTLSGDLATREQLRLLERYVFGILGDMVDKIASGDVTPNPYTRGSSHDACAFCPYGAVCHKASVPGRRNYKAMPADRFWEEVEKEVQRRG